jgi:hypothetical protein
MVKFYFGGPYGMFGKGPGVTFGLPPTENALLAYLDMLEGTGLPWSVSVGAKRYVDVLHGVGGDYVNGKTYTSKPKKLTGPLQEMTHPHLLDVDRQEVAWSVLTHLTGTDQHQAQQSAAAE